MVQAATGITETQARIRFESGGDLHEIIRTPRHKEQALFRYLRGRGSLYNLHRILALGHQHLLQPGHQAGALLATMRAEQVIIGDLGVPESVGYYDPDLIPPCVGVTFKPKKRDDYLSLAYTYNGRLTCLEIRPATNLRECVHRGYRFTDRGVFNEQALDTQPSVVLVARDPLTAVTMSSRYATVFDRQLPVISTLGYQLPPSMSGVKRVVLLSPSDSPLPLSEPICWLPRPLWQGGNHVTVQIAHLPPLSQVRPNELEDLLCDPTSAEAIEPYLTREILESFERSGTFVTRKALTSRPVSPASVKKLASLLSDAGADDELLATLHNFWEESGTSIVLANGNQVLLTESGMVGIRANNDRISLGNTTFAVLARSKTDDGFVFKCRFTCENVMQRLVCWVPASVFWSADNLQEYVSEKMADRGTPAYVAFYAVPGFRLAEIRDALAVHAKYRPALDRLGVDGRQINMSKVLIRPKEFRSTKYFYNTVSDAANRAYRGIRSLVEIDSEFSELLPSVWASDLPEFGGLALGLCHILATLSVQIADPLAMRPPAHLMFADADIDTWRGIVQGLYSVFAGSETMPTLVNPNPRSELTAYEQLGRFPLIAEVGDNGMKPSALQSLSLPLILLAHPNTAAAISDKATNVSFVCLPESRMIVPGWLENDVILALRSQVPLLLQKLLSLNKSHNLGQLESYPVPAVAMYRAIAELMEWEVSDNTVELGTPVFYSGSGSLLATLFRLLQEGIQRGSIIRYDQRSSAVAPGVHHIWDTRHGHTRLYKRTITTLAAANPGMGLRARTVDYLLHSSDLLEEDDAQYWKFKTEKFDELLAAELKIAGEKKA